MTSRDLRQKECVRKWIKSKGKGSIVACTGFGKTRTGLLILKTILDKYPKLRFMVIVPTDNLKTQWSEQLETWELNGNVVVINTASTHQYDTDILVIDEIHRSAANTLIKVFENVTYKYILGLTATFERLDERHTLIEKYCPVIDEITLTEALVNGWVAPFKEYQVLLDVDDIDVYKSYNKEFVEHFEYFSFDWNKVNRCLGKTGFIERARLRDEMCPNGSEEQRKAVFKAITYHATAFMRALQKRKAFINNHPKKVELARKIIEARPESKIITFSNNIKMAESIGYGMVYTGKDSKKKARASLEDFNNALPPVVLNSVAKLREGADLVGLSVAIKLGIDSSELRAVQERGRVIRAEEGKQAEIFNLIINESVECEWFRRSHKDGNYITIDKAGLEDVLAGKEPQPYRKKITDFTLRY